MIAAARWPARSDPANSQMVIPSYWTELGARHVGIVLSLIVTCRLHGIDPYIYLVDVLQRVGQHPASRVAELTPRQWKLHFADQPLRSDLYAIDAG